MTRHVDTVELAHGVALQYVEQGDPSGVPLILLHAIADSWRNFEPMLSHLPESIHALAPTQRGHGDSSRPDAGYRPEDFTADLELFMDAVGVHAAVVVGGSSGGVIARRFAIHCPDRTIALVLLGSPFTLRGKPGLEEIWESTISTMTDPVDPVMVRGFAEGTLARPVPESFFEVVVEENLKVPARVWKATMRGLMEDASSAELHRIRAPTLVVWGDRDDFLPRSDQEELVGAIKGSQLLVYEGAGHAFYWEDPARVAADLAAFVEGLHS